jgi:Cu-processing system permease protein
MCFLPSIRVAVQLALRARFGFIALWLVIITCLAAWMGGQFSGRQPATVALDVGISVIRVVVPILGILMLQELISREFERRYFLSSLTYPRPRHYFLLGRLVGLLILLSLLLLVLAVLLAVVVIWVGKGYAQATPVSLGLPYWVTFLFVFLDLLVVLSMGALLAVVASTPSFIIIGSVGFMLIARSFSTIVYLLQHDGWLVSNSGAYGGSLNLLMYVMPDLAALDVRMVALYGRMELLPADWPWLALYSAAYALALLAVSVYALNRKRFF